ncbi:MAG: zinc ribbon domain-containing protein [Desulfosalsimonadaceae bacterium]|nr:zinc ribbon domain-containing protein [Desulfosalsimonadaceae bacterium]
MIKNRLITFKNRLFRINDEEPLSKLSVCVIIALDLFILFVVFRGLDDHIRQLTSPADYLPYDCREILVRENWTDADKIEKLQQLTLSDYNNVSYGYDSPFEHTKTERMHPDCRLFFEKIEAIARDKEILEWFKDRQRLVSRKNQFTAGFEQSKGVYDTSLLEDIAEPEPGQNKLPSIAQSMKDKARQIDIFDGQIAVIDARINNHAKVRDLWAYVSAGDPARRDRLVEDIKRWEFRYPFKELFWQMLFLLPLFIVFYLWSVRSVKKDNRLQVLISSHLLVIVSIPIFMKTLDVVLTLIPRHFFKKFFALLTALRIIAVWHYLVIVAAIGAALLAIYIIQKKVFNKRRLELKRLSKGLCRHCGKKLPPNAAACPFCGADQMVRCPACDHPTYAAGEYCVACGKDLPKL